MEYPKVQQWDHYCFFLCKFQENFSFLYISMSSEMFLVVFIFTDLWNTTQKMV